MASPLLTAREASNFARKTSEHEGVTTGDPAKDGFRKIATTSAATPADNNEAIRTLVANEGFGAGFTQDGTSIDSYAEQPETIDSGSGQPEGPGYKNK